MTLNQQVRGSIPCGCTAVGGLDRGSNDIVEFYSLARDQQPTYSYLIKKGYD